MIPIIKFSNVSEHFGMSGPFLGTLELNGNFLKNEFLADNYIYSPDNDLLFLNLYLSPKTQKVLGLFSFTPNIRDFRILVYDIKFDAFYMSKTSFDAIYLSEFNGSTLTTYNAFHDKLIQTQQAIEFNEENFFEVETSFVQ